MGSNYFILDKKSKEYCWLGKTLNVDKLVRFLYEHPTERTYNGKAEGLYFGSSQGYLDLQEEFFGVYDPRMATEMFTEVEYSLET